MKKYTTLIFWLILATALALRIIPILSNNYYFTMDQGYTAINVREIISRGIIPLKGPETSLQGVYAGPAWFWFQAIGYGLFAGNPLGGNFVLILLNIIILGILIKTISKAISPNVGYLVGIYLIIFWSFYEVSRYAFNPFPMVFLVLLTFIFLIKFLDGNKPYFVYAAIPIGLSFHMEVASFVPFLIFYFILSLVFLFKKKINFKLLFISFLVICLCFLPSLISEIGNSFSQTKALINQFQNSNGDFGGTQFKYISYKFLSIISESTIPQSVTAGVLFFISSILAFILGKSKKIKIVKNDFSDYFIYFTILLTIISWLFFGTNRGWHAWQTIYLPPLLFLSVIFIIIRLKSPLKFLALLFLFFIQLTFFIQRYEENFKSSSDQSIIANEIKAIDWVYQQSQGQGFFVYNYLPSVYDTPYQYLFWWYGKKTYGYLPCEYASYPGSPKIFVPGAKYYEDPKRKCSNLRYLIVEPDKNTFVRERWLSDLRENTKLLEQTIVGNISLEKREITTKLD